MARESSKAMRRRWCEAAEGKFPWKKIFKGRGIDVGCGDDPLPFPGCQPFDQQHGDANKLSSYYPPGHFDYLHSSQSLEHMLDPREALADWLKVVKSGGHLIITVPSWELYEGMRFPSVFNPDHKSTWSMTLPKSSAPIHILVPEYLQTLDVEVLICRQVDTNYDHRIGTKKDQTWEESDGVEAFIELVLKKP